MKVLDLQCHHRHRFEGWFASEDDFLQQLTRGILECPVCADKDIVKMPSAPRLNLGGAPSDASVRTEAHPAHAGSASDVQRDFLAAVRHVLAHTENVGDRFVQEVRKMHYGEAEERAIRGHATSAQALELIEEGIPVMPLPAPDYLDKTLQ